MTKAPVGPKYYIAGPMTGHPEHNYPYFGKVAERLRGQGYHIVSPHEIEYGETMETRGQKEWSYYLRKTLLALLESDAIVLLPGWRTSKGAMAEFRLAVMSGMAVYYYGLGMDYPYELP